MSGVEPVERRFVPPESDVSRPFWDATRERRLSLQWCEPCDAAVQFPRTHCPRCGGDQLVWRESSGRGVVYAVSVHHVAGQPAFADRLPYAVALVELEGGARLMTNLVGDGALSAQVGDPVAVAWEPLPDGRHLPLFTVG